MAETEQTKAVVKADGLIKLHTEIIHEMLISPWDTPHRVILPLWT